MKVSYEGREYGLGDVVWTVDPFKLGGDVSRMFAIVTTETHPFQGKQFVGVPLTTTDHLIEITSASPVFRRGSSGHVARLSVESSPWPPLARMRRTR